MGKEYRDVVWPEFTISYGLLTLGLGCLDLLAGNNCTTQQKFWINFIGLNATIIIPAIIAFLVGNIS